ncbi:MAG: biotin-dependent carboxyltransferase family protein [Phycisphaeraceae bacterium]|nr:biotin-dependent carboxyltransferase family protein [Phycisphaeraceae bacterium]
MANVHVISAGMHTTVQDLGRAGYAAIGVPPSGAADPLSLRLGNRIVGNADNAAGLEFTLTGPVLRFEHESFIAITGGQGAEVSLERAGERVEVVSHRAVRVAANDRLVVKRVLGAARGYLCVSGGISVNVVLASRSTLASAGLGGLAGRALQPGDVIPVGRAAGPTCQDERAAAAGAWAAHVLARRHLRVVPGLNADAFSSAALRTMMECEYTVADQSDRRGVRLLGPCVSDACDGGQLPSEGVAPGSVQVPDGGAPIILGVDRPTTGGYPVAACVIAADMPIVGAILPRTPVRFELSTRQAAREAWANQEAQFDELLPAPTGGRL